MHAPKHTHTQPTIHMNTKKQNQTSSKRESTTFLANIHSPMKQKKKPDISDLDLVAEDKAAAGDFVPPTLCLNERKQDGQAIETFSKSSSLKK